VAYIFRELHWFGFVEMLLYIGILLVDISISGRKGVGLESPSRTPGPRFVTETPDLEKIQMSQESAPGAQGNFPIDFFPRGVDPGRASRTPAALAEFLAGESISLSPIFPTSRASIDSPSSRGLS